MIGCYGNLSCGTRGDKGINKNYTLRGIMARAQYGRINREPFFRRYR